MSKIIIVEGKTDKERLMEILDEPVEIVLTHGTLGYQEMENLVASLQDEEIYVLVDADDAGQKLRKQLNMEIPNLHHLYTRKMYREVATTPLEHLAEILERAHFKVKENISEEGLPI